MNMKLSLLKQLVVIPKTTIRKDWFCALSVFASEGDGFYVLKCFCMKLKKLLLIFCIFSESLAHVGPNNTRLKKKYTVLGGLPPSSNLAFFSKTRFFLNIFFRLKKCILDEE